jgi:hypothetical protein
VSLDGDDAPVRRGDARGTELGSKQEGGRLQHSFDDGADRAGTTSLAEAVSAADDPEADLASPRGAALAAAMMELERLGEAKALL